MKTMLALLLLAAALAAPGCAPSGTPTLATTLDASGRPLDSATQFTPDTPRIICAVPTSGLPATAAVSAAWAYDEGEGRWKPLKEQSLPAASGAWLDFTLDMPAGGWATGSYRVVLQLDGKEMSSPGFSIAANPAQALPLIHNFSATPEKVTAGQPLTLSWNVSGATRVTISPGIGSVEAGGSRMVSPTADTTYTLTAVNGAGPASKSLAVRAVPPVTTRAELWLVDIFRESPMVYYTVRNDGTASSLPSSANLYVDANVKASGYIPPLAPGEQRTLYFGTFNWSYRYDTPATVCIDTKDENGPATEYKCLTRLLPGARVF
jgi:hypothetical protein